MREPVGGRGPRRGAWPVVVVLAASALALVPAVPQLTSAATFTGSTTVTGNAIGPRSCTAAATWNAAVAGLSGLTDWIRLGEASGTTAADAAGGTAWSYSSTFAYSVSGALFCQAAPFGNGVDPTSSTARVSSPTAGAYSSTLGSFATGVTEMVWFKGSTAVEAGRLLGLGNTTANGTTTTYTDRVLWVDSTGVVRFGTVGGTVLSSSTGHLDGRWHLAAVTMTSTSAVLYVDGVAVASTASPSYRPFGAVNVYWRIGYDSSTAAGRKPATAPTSPFTGPVDEAVIARSALPAATVASLWAAGGAP